MKLIKAYHFVGLFILFTFTHCVNVHQIDRGRLSKRIMSFEPSPEEKSFLTEIHNIREGSAGGTGQNSGGGCGCN